LSCYADTSFLVSLYGRDANSHAAILLAQEQRPFFLVTPFSEAEFASIVFAITSRPKGWTVSEARTIEEDFVRDLEASVWGRKEFPAQTWQRARELSRRHAPTLGSRALDVIHVASALVLGAEDFYTFDQDQAKLARAAGLRVMGSR
jgi:predicted nucleic acid-binding protein